MMIIIICRLPASSASPPPLTLLSPRPRAEGVRGAHPPPPPPPLNSHPPPLQHHHHHSPGCQQLTPLNNNDNNISNDNIIMMIIIVIVIVIVIVISNAHALQVPLRGAGDRPGHRQLIPLNNEVIIIIMIIIIIIIIIPRRCLYGVQEIGLVIDNPFFTWEGEDDAGHAGPASELLLEGLPMAIICRTLRLYIYIYIYYY